MLHLPHPIDGLRRRARARAAPLVARWHALHPDARGAAWVTLAALAFASMSGLIKLLTLGYDTAQIVFLRAALSLVALAPWVLATGVRRTFATRRPGGHLLRATIGLAAMGCSIWALQYLPVAQATAISFARPLMAIPLAVIFLGEVVRLRRWGATVVGFIGVLIAMQPRPDDLNPAVFVALLGALFAADSGILIKKLVSTEASLTIVAWFATIASAVTLVPALLVWRAPTAADLAVFMAIGALGGIGQFATARGFAAGDATVVMPFDYTRLLFAAGVGFVLFGEVPSLWTYVGSLIAAGSAVYIVHRERAVKAATVRAPGGGQGNG